MIKRNNKQIVLSQWTLLPHSAGYVHHFKPLSTRRKWLICDTTQGELWQPSLHSCVCCWFDHALLNFHIGAHAMCVVLGIRHVETYMGNVLFTCFR